MSAPNWWTALAVLVAAAAPAWAAAQSPSTPQPLPTGAPGQRVIIVTAAADGTTSNVVSGTIVSADVLPAAMAEAAPAKPLRNHPVWNCIKACAAGPYYRMPLDCASCKAEMTFLFGSCQAFFNQCESPYSKGDKGCGCKNR
jgi:hypothetical protein